MNAELKTIMSLDVDDLAIWRPSAEDFAIAIRLIVGPAGLPGEESFDLTVCSAAWISTRVEADGIFDARHHFVVDGFNFPAIRSYFTRRVAQCEGETWSDIAAKLTRIGYWEFENYSD
jgi:hypothetical protein